MITASADTINGRTLANVLKSGSNGFLSVFTVIAPLFLMYTKKHTWAQEKPQDIAFPAIHAYKTP